MAVSISAMLHLFETQIQEKNLELVIEYDTKIPEFLVGDPVRLHQIILNFSKQRCEIYKSWQNYSKR